MVASVLVSIDWFKRELPGATPWKRSTMVDIAVAFVLLGVKRQKRFQLSSARTTLSSRPPPLFRARVLSRWLFPALIERLFSAHKMKWISAPEPEIGRHRQHCHPLSVPFLSPSFSCFVLYRHLFPAIFKSHKPLRSHQFLWRARHKFVRTYYNHSSKPSPTVWTATICQSRWIETVVAANCRYGG